MTVCGTFRRLIPSWCLSQEQKIAKFREPFESGERLLLHVNWQVPVQ